MRDEDRVSSTVTVSTYAHQGHSGIVVLVIRQGWRIPARDPTLHALLKEEHLQLLCLTLAKRTSPFAIGGRMLCMFLCVMYVFMC